MKNVLALIGFFFSSPTMADNLVAILQQELSGLNTASPEADAKNDIAQGQASCYSVNGYSRYFPGVTDQDQEYCEVRERNFMGTSDSVLSKEHGALISQAIQYAERYNTYVILQR